MTVIPTSGKIILNIWRLLFGDHLFIVTNGLCSRYPLINCSSNVDCSKILLWRYISYKILSPSVTFFVENVIATKKFDCSQFQGLFLSVAPQSFTPRSTGSPGSVAPCEWFLLTIWLDAKNRYTARLLNFAHTEYSTYYKCNHYLNTRLSNGFLKLKRVGEWIYTATKADALKEESVASVAEFLLTSMCWNMALLYLFFRPPPFLPSVCVHNNTREQKTGEKIKIPVFPSNVLFWMQMKGKNVEA